MNLEVSGRVGYRCEQVFCLRAASRFAPLWLELAPPRLELVEVRIGNLRVPVASHGEGRYRFSKHERVDPMLDVTVRVRNDGVTVLAGVEIFGAGIGGAP